MWRSQGLGLRPLQAIEAERGQPHTPRAYADANKPPCRATRLADPSCQATEALAARRAVATQAHEAARLHPGRKKEPLLRRGAKASSPRAGEQPRIARNGRQPTGPVIHLASRQMRPIGEGIQRSRSDSCGRIRRLTEVRVR